MFVMITTVTGKITKIGQGRYTSGSNTPVIDFTMSVDRGNTKKRKSMLNGQEYSVDFYKVSLYGQSALSFAQYAQIGRLVEVSGRLLQEEYVATNQTVQVTPDNPLFGYFAQLVGKLPQEVLGSDGTNIYIKGNFPVNRTNITCMEYRWRESNPNASTESGFGGFQPQNNSFNAQGFNNAQAGFSGQTPTGFGAQPQGFGATQPQAPIAGFGSAPQANNQGFGGFGQTSQVGGFGQGGASVATGFGVAPVGFTAQQNPSAPANFAGFGAPSEQPQGFGATNGFGTGTQVQVTEQALEQVMNMNFVPDPNANAGTGFTPEANPTGATTATVETNIPSATNTANADKTEDKKDTSNQGF